MTGAAVIELKAGVSPKLVHLEAINVKEAAKIGFATRLQLIKRELDRVIQSTSPNVVAVERIFFGKNVDSAFKLGHARGVCLLAAAENGLGVHEYAARSVKKAVTGSGKADKMNVQIILRQMFNLPPDCPWDASDALAVALTHSIALQNPLRNLEAEV